MREASWTHTVPGGRVMRDEEEKIWCEVQGWWCHAEPRRHWLQMKIHLFASLNICRCFTSIKFPQCNSSVSVDTAAVIACVSPPPHTHTLLHRRRDWGVEMLTNLSSTCGDSSDCSRIIGISWGKISDDQRFWHPSQHLTETWRSKLSSSAGNSALDTSLLLNPCGIFHSHTWKTWIETPKAN